MMRSHDALAIMGEIECLANCYRYTQYYDMMTQSQYAHGREGVLHKGSYKRGILHKGVCALLCTL